VRRAPRAARARRCAGAPVVAAVVMACAAAPQRAARGARAGGDRAAVSARRSECAPQ